MILIRTSAGPRGSASPRRASARWPRRWPPLLDPPVASPRTAWARRPRGGRRRGPRRGAAAGEPALSRRGGEERSRLRRQLAALADALRGRRLRQRPPRARLGAGVPQRLRVKAAGRLLARRSRPSARLLGEPERPFVAILGGAKIEGKIDTLDNLLPRLDTLLLGGGMANTFLAAAGVRGSAPRSSSPTGCPGAASSSEGAKAKGTQVLCRATWWWPTNLRLAGADSETVPADPGAGRQEGAGHGQETQRRLRGGGRPRAPCSGTARMGVFEKPPFDAGTRAVARPWPPAQASR